MMQFIGSENQDVSYLSNIRFENVTLNDNLIYFSNLCLNVTNITIKNIKKENFEFNINFATRYGGLCF